MRADRCTCRPHAVTRASESKILLDSFAVDLTTKSEAVCKDVVTHGTVYTGRSISPEMIQQYMSTQLGECGQQTLKSSDTQTQSPSRPDADKLNVWITGHSSSKPSICSPPVHSAPVHSVHPHAILRRHCDSSHLCSCHSFCTSHLQQHLLSQHIPRRSLGTMMCCCILLQSCIPGLGAEVGLDKNIKYTAVSTTQVEQR